MMYIQNSVLPTPYSYQYRLFTLQGFGAFFTVTIIHGVMSCGEKPLKIMWRCHQLLTGVLAKGRLSRVSRQSCFSANTKGDNKMVPEAVYRSNDIYFTVEEYLNWEKV